MQNFFAEKMWKATHIFQQKNIRILYIESAKTVNEMTLNELVKLTTLWTTGSRFLRFIQILSNGDNMNEMPNPVFWKKEEKNTTNLLSANKPSG